MQINILFVIETFKLDKGESVSCLSIVKSHFVESTKCFLRRNENYIFFDKKTIKKSENLR